MENTRTDFAGVTKHDRINKIKYSKRKWAKRYIKKNEKWAGCKLYVYKCPECGFWHITSRKR